MQSTHLNSRLKLTISMYTACHLPSCRGLIIILHINRRGRNCGCVLFSRYEMAAINTRTLCDLMKHET